MMHKKLVITLTQHKAAGILLGKVVSFLDIMFLVCRSCEFLIGSVVYFVQLRFVCCPESWVLPLVGWDKIK